MYIQDYHTNKEIKLSTIFQNSKFILIEEKMGVAIWFHKIQILNSLKTSFSLKERVMDNIHCTFKFWDFNNKTVLDFKNLNLNFFDSKYPIKNIDILSIIIANMAHLTEEEFKKHKNNIQKAIKNTIQLEHPGFKEFANEWFRLEPEKFVIQLKSNLKDYFDKDGLFFKNFNGENNLPLKEAALILNLFQEDIKYRKIFTIFPLIILYYSLYDANSLYSTQIIKEDNILLEDFFEVLCNTSNRYIISSYDYDELKKLKSFDTLFQVDKVEIVTDQFQQHKIQITTNQNKFILKFIANNQEGKPYKLH